MNRTWIHLCGAVLTLCWGIISPKAQSEPSAGLVPLPVILDWREGIYRLTATSCLAAEGDAAVEARKLADAWAPALGFHLKLREKPAARDCIVLTMDASARERLGEEGYELEVGRELVTLRAAGAAGLFFGSQLFRQLLPPAIFGSKPADGVAWQVPCVRIVDYKAAAST